jgi:hypothetical protein
MPSDAKPLLIRNRRPSRWFEMLTGMLVVVILFGTVGLFFGSPGFKRMMAAVILGGMLGLVPICLYGFFQIWDLRRPVPSRPVTARMLFDWLVLGIRRKELGPADGWTALIAIRPLLDSRYLVSHLKLGDEVEVDNPIVRYPARAVARVRFAPDPKEDYAGAEGPMRLCDAIVEVDSGREFHLFVTEADAQRLRQWAVTKGITVCDCDGYCPRPIEPPSEDA